MGFNPLSASSRTYSVPAVGEEMLHDSLAYMRYRASLEHAALMIREPSDVARRTVQTESSQAGEEESLSKADKELLALAWDLEREGEQPIVVSDDYAIQNIAHILKLKFRSLATYGIRHRFSWILFCPACFRKFRKVETANCPICGTILKRKALRGESARPSLEDSPLF